MSIVSFETPDDSCIQWLNKQGHVRLKIYQLNILRFIADKMARKIVKGKADMSFLNVHLDIKIFNISVDNIRSS